MLRRELAKLRTGEVTCLCVCICVCMCVCVCACLSVSVCVCACVAQMRISCPLIVRLTSS